MVVAVAAVAVAVAVAVTTVAVTAAAAAAAAVLVAAMLVPAPRARPAVDVTRKPYEASHAIGPCRRSGWHHIPATHDKIPRHGRHDGAGHVKSPHIHGPATNAPC